MSASSALPSRLRRVLRSIKRITLLLLLIVVIAAAALAVFEAQTSWFQAREFSPYAASLDYALERGPSEAIRLPEHGPFDERLGYARLGRFTERLTARDFVIDEQVRFSPALMNFATLGYFPPYREKTRAGLHVTDANGEALYDYRYPAHAYDAFESVPRVLVDSLLFIENRRLLDFEQPNQNPAVDWPRFGRALFAQLAKMVDEDLDTPGGSTLATQIEKYRHSPDGVTYSPREKLRQMVSATVRAYRDGIETMPARRDIVLDYLNTVPLSAAPAYGEVNGIGDGLWVWYGADFDTVNRLLSAPAAEGEELAAQGLALRQALSLMVAHRRPSHYLGRGRDELIRLTDSHVRVLGEAGVIAPELKRAALESDLRFRDTVARPAHVPVDPDKASTLVRTRLAGLLDVSLYELDRLDLDVAATLDGELQRAVGRYLRSLSDPEVAKQAGLLGERLLAPGKLRSVNYSFTLFEHTAGGNRVRVQTDTTDQPLDINEGSKLELGSTAKLRVLATYLELIAELHQRFAEQPAAALREVAVDRQDVLTRWAIDYLIQNDDRSLPEMLDAALERRYSASPAEAFFTGGGLHTFNNFRSEDNGRMPTLREALQESINLPFVRLMRDLVRHTMYQVPGSTAKLLEDDSDPRRDEYLAKFADREGQVFLRRFWRKYQGMAPQDIQATLLDGLRPTVDRLAAVHRYLNPMADLDAFSTFIRERFPDRSLRDAQVASLYRRYAPGSFDLPDQGYIARVHPLELWLVGYLSANPGASYAEAMEASREERQAVYRWLFRSRAKSAQDSRIYTILEVEAFLELHRRWQRLGYPFNHLVPSLATALGSSGDRPAALAELMGIIVNDGLRLPTARIDSLRFAADTPYETRFVRRDTAGERVMLPEVAAALRHALSDVVEGGTARRLAGAFKLEDGSALVLGGKTGTGDNRIVTMGSGGVVKSSVALNRTATFAFYLGDRHFGTLTAYVTGPDAAGYRFTSGLPVQILKTMGPVLVPYIEARRRALATSPTVADTSAAEPEPAAQPEIQGGAPADGSAEAVVAEPVVAAIGAPNAPSE